MTFNPELECRGVGAEKIDAGDIAKPFREEIRAQVKKLKDAGIGTLSEGGACFISLFHPASSSTVSCYMLHLLH